jgi:regulator of protease activity HflC (stomatin/prohibitin superfamily)
MKVYAHVLARVAILIALIFAFDGGFSLLNVHNDFAAAGGCFLIAACLTFSVLWAIKDGGRLLNHAKKAIGPLAVVALSFVVLTTTGCYKIIPPGHAGIVVQQTGSARGVNQIPVETGRVFYNPFNEDVLDYPTYVQRAIWTASTSEGKKDEKGERSNEEIAFQSSDSLHFTGDVAVAYQLQSEKVPHFYVQFRSDDLENFTHGFFRDAVRKSIGIAAQQFTQEEINGGKQADLEHQAEDILRKSMEPFGVNIVQLAFTSPPRPPDQVKQAIQGKVAAIQKAEQIENEKRQSVAEGAKNIALAQAQAQANALITSSITPTLLQWEQLKVMQNKWDGHMPMVNGGSSPLMLQLPK